MNDQSNEISRSTTKVLYILFLIGAFFPLLGLIAVIIAHFSKVGDAIEASHRRHQIRTFWFGLLFGIIGIITLLIGVGFIVLGFTVVWNLARLITGLLLLGEGKPVERTKALGIVAV